MRTLDGMSKRYRQPVLAAAAAVFVAGAMFGAYTVAGSFNPHAPAQPTITVHNAGQDAPAPTVTVTKAPVAKPVAKKMTRKTTTTTRSLVNAQAATDPTPDPPATLTPPPPVIGSGAGPFDVSTPPAH